MAGAAGAAVEIEPLAKQGWVQTNNAEVRPAVSNYLRKHQIDRVFECIIMALAVEIPSDPRDFIKRKLVELKALGPQSWDVLIPKELREQHLTLPFWLAKEDPWDDDKPTETQCITAYSYNNRRLMKRTLWLWRVGVEERRQEKRRMVLLLLQKRKVRKESVCVRVIRAWRGLSQLNYHNRQAAYNILAEKDRLRRMRPVFTAWLRAAQNTLTATKWFEQLAVGDEKDMMLDVGGGGDFSKLSKSVRLLIFKNLDMRDLCHCAQVSISWKEVVQDPSLWEHLDFTPISNKVTDDVVKKIVERYRPILTRANFRDCNCLTVEACFQIGNCQNLQDLNLSGCNWLSDGVVKDLTEGCRSLIFLNLSYSNVSDLGLRYLSLNCATLEYLSLAYCESLTDAGAMSLGDGNGCNRLRWLDLSGCRDFSSEGLQGVVMNCGGSLEVLLLDAITTLRSSVLQSVGEFCGNLIRISLQSSYTVTDAGLRGLSRCHKLQQFDISHNSKVTGHGFRGMVRGCKSLTRISIANCALMGNEGLAALATTNLVYLDVRHCSILTDHSIRSLSEGGIGPRRCLQSLILSGCTGLSEQGFGQLGLRFNALSRLVIRSCPRLSDACFERIAELRCLQYLDISNCSNVGDDALKTLGKAPRPLLEHLFFAGCDIGDGGLEELSKGCHSIKTLSISNCVQVSDEALRNITAVNCWIESIDVQGCTLLTDKTLHCIVHCCPVLNEMNLFGLPKLTSKAIESHMSSCRYLRRVFLTDGLGISLESVRAFKAKREQVDVYFNTSNHPPPPFYTSYF